jgi:DNA-binding PadR family transcriptional regulator
MKRRTVANPLGLAVLAWLVTGPMHPYELGRRLTEAKKDRSIKYNRGSLYMVVEQLEKAGFITAHETVRDSQRPERTVYALTDDGRRELYDWMAELVAEPRHEYPQFGVALSLLSVLSPADAVELLTRRSAALETEIESVRGEIQAASAQGVQWVFLIEDDYRLALLQAEHRFVGGLIEALAAPDYLTAWQEAFGGRS